MRLGCYVSRVVSSRHQPGQKDPENDKDGLAIEPWRPGPSLALLVLRDRSRRASSSRSTSTSQALVSFYPFKLCATHPSIASSPVTSDSPASSNAPRSPRPPRAIRPGHLFRERVGKRPRVDLPHARRNTNCSILAMRSVFPGRLLPSCQGCSSETSDG